MDADSGRDQFVHQYVGGGQNDGVGLRQLQSAVDDGYLPAGHGIAAMAVDWRHVGGLDTGHYLDADLSRCGYRHAFSGADGRWRLC